MAEDATSFSGLNREKIRAIAATFEQEMESPRAIIFCLTCGSTSLDQNAINRLYCNACGSTAIWNGFRFGVARPAHALSDFNASIESAYWSEYFDQWHVEMDDAVRGFMEAVLGDGATRGFQISVEDRAAQLQQKWEATKVRIDELMARRS